MSTVLLIIGVTGCISNWLAWKCHVLAVLDHQAMALAHQRALIELYVENLKQLRTRNCHLRSSLNSCTAEAGT